MATEDPRDYMWLMYRNNEVELYKLSHTFAERMSEIQRKRQDEEWLKRQIADLTDLRRK